MSNHDKLHFLACCSFMCIFGAYSDKNKKHSHYSKRCTEAYNLAQKDPYALTLYFNLINFISGEQNAG